MFGYQPTSSLPISFAKLMKSTSSFLDLNYCLSFMMVGLVSLRMMRVSSLESFFQMLAAVVLGEKT